MDDQEFVQAPIEVNPGNVNPFVADDKTKAQLTFVGTIYYQSSELENNNSAIEVRTSQNLTTDEQPFSRLFWVDEAWRPIETGWLQDASFMVIDNRGVRAGNVNPTDEQLKAEQQAVLEVGIMPPTVTEPRTMHSPPKQEPQPVLFCRLNPQYKLPVPSPQNLTRYYLRCVKGKTKVSLSIFPL